MLLAKSLLLFFVLCPGHPLLGPSPALPLNGRDTGIQARRSKKQSAGNTSAQAATGTTAKVSTATDGSTIIDDSVSGLTMRYKVSAPSTEFVANSGQAPGTLGINVLFHGDGGQSFVDFPNQGVNANLIGVALLAPDADLRWGGSDPNDATGLIITKRRPLD
ncbi:hypothetical protein GGX14DRAFT_376635 [Mycena pura]|uniref:Uncharacterized protein n=1 Tax=Mycena pura TaxID=153505 RepID=A0AAD6V2R6_9AGAR|nr:hypothetical protein GGX14DRAFT_376635 [Mycena pura]